MHCEWVKQNLSAYIDGELGSGLADGLKEHLSSCNSCSAEYHAMVRAWEMLDAWEDVLPPERLRQNILSDVRRFRRQKWTMMMIPAAAALIIVIAAFLLFGTGVREEQGLLAVRSETALVLSDRDLAEREKEEIIANLQLLQERDFYESIETLRKIDYLPLVGEEPRGEDGQSSSLEYAVT